jgi:FtsP/CotA-like multicopper oxidase with cupredoxin domain
MESWQKGDPLRVSRRELLKRSGLLGLGLLAAGCGGTADDFIFTNPPATNPSVPAVDFFQPPVLRSAGGYLSVPFQFDYATHQVGTPNGQRNFLARSINGTLAPPTIRLRQGDRLEIPITNSLPANPEHHMPTDENTPHHFNTVNMHTHGLHISPAQDNVLLLIEPGGFFKYEYDIPADHPHGTFWYHPHKHGATAMHLFSGMTGMLIVEGGGIDNVPEVAAAADLVFNINELQLQGFGDEPGTVQNPYVVPDYVNPSPFDQDDSVWVVNGQYQPTMTVRPGQVVRLRILNSSARSGVPLAVNGPAPVNWNVIAFDGLTLPQMMTVPEFTLFSANRADVLVRFDTPGSYTIEKGASPGTGTGLQPALTLARVEVVGEPFPQALPAGPLPVPTGLPDISADELTEAQPRPLIYAVQPASSGLGPVIGGTAAPNFTINGARFSSTTINQVIPLGSVLEWSLINRTGAFHPHHIHIQDFQVVATSDGKLNGLVFTDPNDPDPEKPIANFFPQPVWLDTVAIPPHGWVRVRQRFPDFPGLFVLHCHVLVHEDIGMMQLVNVV